MRIDTTPLLAHESASQVVAYRAGVAIQAGRFLADAAHLADRLPPGRHVLNVCSDRYRFTVGLAACLMTERVSLLPSTHTPEVIRELARFAPDAVCLTDEATCTIELPRIPFPEALPGPCGTFQVPQIPTAQQAAIVFTSGSTGLPLPYRKTWGKLSRCVRDGAARLGLADGAQHTLVGTVPAQHMYGFESTVLVALLTGNAFAAERPFYPADIRAAVAAVPRPRALITTPVHLRTLLASGMDLPPLDLIVSATAPLGAELAREVEATYRTQLLEIYGSTETGQIATRRTAECAAWQLWPQVRLVARGAGVLAEGGHVEQPTALGDVIEITGERSFLLHGRTADMVNVAGKRSSFGYLNSQLNAIPGVLDGVFFLRDPEDAGAGTGVARLAAAVVAPTLTTAHLAEQLRQRLDPVFLPRPLLLVERLPRNATGKLPIEALRSLVGRRPHGQRDMSSDLPILTDHPAYAGHFPGFPILPGAVLLDEALTRIERSRLIDLKEWRIASAKFLQVVRPGCALTLEHSAPDAATIRFAIRCANRTVVSGSLSMISGLATARMALDPTDLVDSPQAAEWLGNRERGSAALLRLMAFLSLRLGRTASRIPLYGIAAYFFSFAPGARRQSLRYLRRALGRAPRARDRFRHVLNFATTIHDRVYLINEQYDVFRVTIEGEALMQAQLASGQGAFLMGSHMGSFEVIGSVGRRQPGLQVSMAMYEDNARKINAILAAINPKARPDIISLGHVDAMLRIGDRLDRGAFVGMLGDRTLGDEPVHEVSILGERAYLPTGPMRAAAILRRPVFFMAGLYRGGNHYHVVFESVADFSSVPPKQRDAAVRAAVERYAAILDHHCRDDPYNWFNFFDFWRKPGSDANS